jgi:hypothetical protein
MDWLLAAAIVHFAITVGLVVAFVTKVNGGLDDDYCDARSCFVPGRVC